MNGKSDASIPNVHISSSGGVDMDALRDISAADFNDEYGESEEKAKEIYEPAKKAAARVKARNQDFEDDDEEEETFGSDEEEDEEEEELEDSEEEEDGEEEEDEEDDEENEDEDEEEGEKKPSKFYTLKDANGKEIKLPRDGTVTVPVDGKDVEMSVDELISKASAETYGAAEMARIGREKVSIKKEREALEAERRETKEVWELLMESSQTGNPEDFVQTLAVLGGKNPDEVLANMLKGALEYASQFNGMTQREIQLYNENRRHRFQQSLEQRIQARQQRQHSERADLEQAQTLMQAEGISLEEWEEAAKQAMELVDSGQIQQKLSAVDITQIAIVRRHEARFDEVVGKIDKKRLADSETMRQIYAEAWHKQHLTGRRMTDAEAAKFVREVLGLDTTRLSESLSKKAEKAKAGSPKSKPASSQKRKKKKSSSARSNGAPQGGYAALLREHQSRIYGGE